MRTGLPTSWLALPLGAGCWAPDTGGVPSHGSSFSVPFNQCQRPRQDETWVECQAHSVGIWERSLAPLGFCRQTQPSTPLGICPTPNPCLDAKQPKTTNAAHLSSHPQCAFAKRQPQTCLSQAHTWIAACFLPLVELAKRSSVVSTDSVILGNSCNSLLSTAGVIANTY